MKGLLQELLRSLSSKDQSILEGENKSPKKIERRRDETAIHVGIDFGTSSTKIAYFQHGSIGNKIQPVLFNHGLESYPEYCLPSLAVFDDGNDFLLGKEAAKFLSTKPWDQGLRYFKMIVAGKYNDSFYDKTSTQNFNQSLRNNKYDVEHVTAAFLAYTIRNSKKLIEKLCSGYPLSFAFNVCIPIDQVEDSKVKPIFDKILACSQEIEIKWADETNHKDLLDLAKTNLENAEYDEKNPKTRVFSVPEAVAEVASYFKSLKSQDGLHAVIDIGAGSTDVSIFYLHNIRQTGERSFWYAARNLPRGGQRVEKIIFDCITEIGREPSDILVLDQLNNFRQAPQDLQNKVKKELMELREESVPVWQLAYGKEANELSWRQEKVKVFLCGGGSNFPFVKDIFKESWMPSWGPYPISDLPCEEDYNSTDAPFKRMSVAFGLAQPTPMFSKYTLPNDCPDRTPAQLPLRLPINPYPENP
jgi:hypothetical protein